jgi:FkbM family methyltransferase
VIGRAMRGIFFRLRSGCKRLHARLREARYWLARRGQIANAGEMFRLATRCEAALAAHRRSEQDRAERHRLRFRDGLELEFDLTQATSLRSLAETYPTYMTGLGIELRPGDRVIDLGAHIGSFAVLAAWRNAGVEVLAYEPDPANFELLERNVRLNGLEDRVKCFRQAAAGHAGELEFHVGTTSTTGTLAEAGYVKNPDRPPTECIRVPAVTLEEIFAAHDVDRCRLLKIDIEGAEYDLLAAAPDDLPARVDALVIEAHPIETHRPEELERNLIILGFEVNDRNLSNGCRELYARNAFSRRGKIL